MNKLIFITGSSGFVGKNIIHKLSNYDFTKYNKNTKIIIKEDVIINLAGKAHDIKNVTDPLSYYESNTEFTKKLFDAFIISEAKLFITFSSVKAVADSITDDLKENHIPNPKTDYGKSKLLAEQYILKQEIPFGKRVFILRPCMIHGPQNKGNLNLLFNMIKMGIPWPLANFDNKRSFCSIDNLCFILNEIIQNESIQSGIYNIADNEPLSTNELITLISNSLGKKPRLWRIPKKYITKLARLGDIFKLPLNTERFLKLTESYVVNNTKIIKALKKPLPYSSKEGLMNTFNSFR